MSRSGQVHKIFAGREPFAMKNLFDLYARSARTLVVLAFSLLLPLISFSQTTSTIHGRVTDKQHLGVAGAEVHVTGNNVVADYTVQTDSQGEYRISALPAGNYKLSVSRDGFRTSLFNNLEVALNHVVNFDVELEVGSRHEQVEISSEVPLLESVTAGHRAACHFRDRVS